MASDANEAGAMKPPTPESAPPLLETRAITKRYPGVVALDRVDFALRAGEVHALVGENGAGKTTLVRTIAGAIQADGGEVALHGELVRPRSPAQALALGITAVHQEVDLVPHWSVAENLFLGRQPARFGLIRWKEMKRRARDAMARVGMAALDVAQPVDRLPLAARQMVAIARALDLQSRIIIFDEPTSSLDARDTARLFELMRDLRRRGLGIIFITHFLAQVYAISDRITVLRNGRWVGSFDAARLSRLRLIEHMLGRSVDAIAERDPHRPDHTGDAPASVGELRGVDHATQPLLEARGVLQRGALAPFDLAIGRGESVGLAGLLGSGRTEIARVIFGADRPDSGEILLMGKPLRPPKPRRSLRARMAFVPEDRGREGLFAQLSVEDNIFLAVQAQRGWWRRIRPRERRAVADRLVKLLDMRAANLAMPARLLSGGNQQKAILARALAIEPLVLLLDEPTRGIDVGAKAEIERLIASLRKRGVAILFISSELEELARESSRILVLRDRQVIAQLSAQEASVDRIMREIAGESPT